MTHVYDPKTNTAQLFLAFFKFIITYVQLLSPAINTQPKYLNDLTVSRGLM